MMRLATILLAALLLSPALVSPALAQATFVDDFDRQLELIRRETRQRVDQRVPAGQRALIDYGAYATVS